MGEIVHEYVRWLMGSFAEVDSLGEETVGGNGGADVEYESTLAGGTTLGGGITIGYGNTLGGGNVIGVAAGGASTVVVVVQLVKRSRNLEMANSCSWWTVVEAYLTAQERRLLPMWERTGKQPMSLM